MWRPENWNTLKIANEKAGYQALRNSIHQEVGSATLDTYESNLVEAGADAMLQTISDYIADLSNECGGDDKEFRVKLFLWLTKEEVENGS